MNEIMNKIIPRWEWRTFGEDFKAVEASFSRYNVQRIRESAEIYILSTKNDVNVKIRNELLDVKTLETVNEDGLEQWRPRMKASFPLSLSDLEKLTELLEIQLSDNEFCEYQLMSFINLRSFRFQYSSFLRVKYDTRRHIQPIRYKIENEKSIINPKSTYLRMVKEKLFKNPMILIAITAVLISNFVLSRINTILT